MASVTRLDLAGAVRNKTGMTKQQASEVVDTLLEAVLQRLEQGGNVRVSGFGTFAVRAKHVRQGRNPKTGEPVEITARKVVRFKPSWILRRSLSGDLVAGASQQTPAAGAG
ncbi:MAG: integration host factor subunit alpha [Magnetococcus sp. YQC-5]